MKKTIIFLFSLLFCFSQNSLVFAQNQAKADSLLALLPQSADSTKVSLLIKVANLYMRNDTTKFRTYLQQGENIAQQHQLYRWEGKCQQRFAFYLYNVRGEHLVAIKQYQKALKTYEKVSNTEIDRASCYYYISYIYRVMGDVANALQYALKIFKLPKIDQDIETLARAYDLIGQVYYHEQDYEQAIINKEKSLAYYKQKGDNAGIALSLNNLATAYLGMKQYEKAIEINREAMAYHEKDKDSVGMTYPIHNIGDAYLNMREYKKAIPYFELSMRVYGQSGSTVDAAMDYTKLANCLVNIGQIEKAEKYIRQGLKLSGQNNEMNSVIDCYDILSAIDSAKGNFKSALAYHKKATELRDSIDSKEKKDQILKMRTMYDVERKDAENLVLKKDQELSEKTIKQQYGIIIGAIIGVILCVGLAIVLYRSKEQSLKANRQLQAQQEQIEQYNEELRQQNEEINAILELANTQKNELEHQHKEITDSIAYAQRIQQAILPFANRFQKTFGADNFFILYKPRNVVSGDFYWLYEGENPTSPLQNLTTLIVADCTGHGVPGAFMSMIGTQLLQEIVIQKNINSPEKILAKLQKEVTYALKQKETQTFDGMDIAVLAIDKPNQKAYFAGAMNPMIYIQNNELVELKGDKIPIGGVQMGEEAVYTLKTIDLTQPTTFYLFSDGYQDQFGGERNKKFTTKALRELLLQNHAQPLATQEKIFQNTIEQWIAKAKESQTDDITMVGVKVG